MARRLLLVLGVVAFALVAGVGSAVWAIRAQFARGGVASGPWTTNEHVGSSAASPYLRAGVAVGGLLALEKSETVYYTAFSDDSGAPLRTGCVYRIAGRDPAARWWSITAYGADHFLIPNPGKHYSVDRTTVHAATTEASSCGSAATSRSGRRAGSPPARCRRGKRASRSR